VKNLDPQKCSVKLFYFNLHVTVTQDIGPQTRGTQDNNFKNRFPGLDGLETRFKQRGKRQNSFLDNFPPLC